MQHMACTHVGRVSRKHKQIVFPRSRTFGHLKNKPANCYCVTFDVGTLQGRESRRWFMATSA